MKFNSKTLRALLMTVAPLLSFSGPAFADGATRFTGILAEITTPKGATMIYCGITVRETMNRTDDQAGAQVQTGCLNGIKNGIISKGLTLSNSNPAILQKGGQNVGKVLFKDHRYNRTNLPFGSPLLQNGNVSFPGVGNNGDIAINMFDMRGAPAGSSPTAATPRLNLTGNRHGDVVFATFTPGKGGYASLLKQVSIPNNVFDAIF